MAIPPPAPDKAPERRPLLLLLVVLIAFLLIIGGAVVYILSLRPPAGPAPFVEFGPPVFGSPGDATVNVSTASREVGLGAEERQAMIVLVSHQDAALFEAAAASQRAVTFAAVLLALTVLAAGMLVIPMAWLYIRYKRGATIEVKV